MTQDSRHFEISNAIDIHLADNSFNAASRTASNKYQSWYASLLTSIALTAAREEVVYAYADRDPSLPEIRIVVFTTNLVLVADVDPNADGVPSVQVARRRSLIDMKLSASERIDAHERRSYEWPGNLNIVLIYPDPLGLVKITANGANPYAVDRPAPIVTLVEGLSADLADRPAPA